MGEFRTICCAICRHLVWSWALLLLCVSVVGAQSGSPAAANAAASADDPTAPDYVTRLTRPDFDRLARLTSQGKGLDVPGVMSSLTA